MQLVILNKLIKLHEIEKKLHQKEKGNAWISKMSCRPTAYS